MEKLNMNTHPRTADTPLRLSMEVLAVVLTFVTFALLLGFAANGLS